MVTRSSIFRYPRLELDIAQLDATLAAYGFGGGDVDPDRVAALWPPKRDEDLLDRDGFALEFLRATGRVDAGDVADARDLFDALARHADHKGTVASVGLTAATAAAAALRLRAHHRTSDLV